MTCLYSRTYFEVLEAAEDITCHISLPAPRASGACGVRYIDCTISLLLNAQIHIYYVWIVLWGLNRLVGDVSVICVLNACPGIKYCLSRGDGCYECRLLSFSFCDCRMTWLKRKLHSLGLRRRQVAETPLSLLHDATKVDQ